MNIGDLDPICKVLGPGKRYIIWVQGCLKRCKGCYNTQFQSLERNRILSVEYIIEDILKYKNKIEGVTFLGGEPLLQAKQLEYIAKICQKENLSVLCYTGYKYEDVKEKLSVKSLLRYVDVLIDGDYNENLRIMKGYKGSSNQKTIFLTDRYNEEDFDKENLYEITLDGKKLKIKGFYK